MIGSKNDEGAFRIRLSHEERVEAVKCGRRAESCVIARLRLSRVTQRRKFVMYRDWETVLGREVNRTPELC